jgi:excisionase family DNA binding protein
MIDAPRYMSEPIARTVKDFCRAYGIGKTLAYELIAEGRIVAVRAGRRTLILEASAKEWFSSLEKASGNQKSYARRYVRPERGL